MNKKAQVVVVVAVVVVIAILGYVLTNKVSRDDQKVDPNLLAPRQLTEQEQTNRFKKLQNNEIDASASKEEQAAYYGEKADLALGLAKCDDAKTAVDSIRSVLPVGATNRYALVYKCYLEHDKKAAESYRRTIELRLKNSDKLTFVKEQFTYAKQEAAQ